MSQTSDGTSHPATPGRSSAGVGGPPVSPGLVMATVVLFWGLGPPVSKLITAPAVISVLYRFWLSVPLSFALAALVGSPLRWSTVRRAFVPGAAFGINLVFVFLALNASAVAVLSVVTTLQPGFILVVAGPFLGERPSWWHVGWTVVGIGGAALVVLGAGAEFDASPLGVAYAVIAMITFTLYFLLTRRARSRVDGGSGAGSQPAGHDIGALEWMAGITLAAAVTVTPWALLTSSAADFRAVDGTDWIWLAFIIAVTGIAGHALMAWTHRYIEASRSSLYLLAMNVVAIGAAWLIHDEPLNARQLVGGLVVFGAVAAVILRPPSSRSQPVPGDGPRSRFAVRSR